MTISVNELAAALKKADRPVIYGLGGISMEEQRAAVRFAKSLGAVVSVSKRLQPTLTYAGFARFDLVLTAGGDLPESISCKGRVIRDDRLLEADSWRALSSLFRETPIPGAEAFEELKEILLTHERAVFVWAGGRMDERTRRALMRFAGELYELSLMQTGGSPNALGAYEVMLEECGGAAASFAGNKTVTGEAFSDLIPSFHKKADLILRIGEADERIRAEAPCYAIAESADDHERHIRAVSAGGTHLRSDGVPTAAAGGTDGASVLELLAYLAEQLAGLTEEVAR